MARAEAQFREVYPRRIGAHVSLQRGKRQSGAFLGGEPADAGVYVPSLIEDGIDGRMERRQTDMRGVKPRGGRGEVRVVSERAILHPERAYLI